MRGCIVAAVAILAIVFELGGIWLEVRGLRREQVKNAVYSLRPDVVERMRSGPNGELLLRQLSGRSTALIAGSELDPIYVRAEEPIPVEIQR
jgi:hypothetical protein